METIQKEDDGIQNYKPDLLLERSCSLFDKKSNDHPRRILRGLRTNDKYPCHCEQSEANLVFRFVAELILSGVEGLVPDKDIGEKVQPIDI